MDRDLELKRRVDARLSALRSREHAVPRVPLGLRWNVWTYPQDDLEVRFEVPTVGTQRERFFLHAEHIDRLSDDELLQEIEVQRAMILIAG